MLHQRNKSFFGLKELGIILLSLEKRIVPNSCSYMAQGLQFCWNWQVDRKNASPAQCAVHLDHTVMGLNDGLCQREAQADALGVLGKPAAVKPFEDVVYVLRVDATPGVCHGDAHLTGQFSPRDGIGVPAFGGPGRFLQGY